MRNLTPNVLASLMVITVPPEEGSIEFRQPHLRVTKPTSFDLSRLSDLINEYLHMPGVPNV